MKTIKVCYVCVREKRWRKKKGEKGERMESVMWRPYPLFCAAFKVTWFCCPQFLPTLDEESIRTQRTLRHWFLNRTSWFVVLAKGGKQRNRPLDKQSVQKRMAGCGCPAEDGGSENWWLDPKLKKERDWTGATSGLFVSFGETLGRQSQESLLGGS